MSSYLVASTLAIRLIVFQLRVVTGTPITIERVKLVAPRLLLTLKVSVSELPHAVPAGTVKVAVWLTVEPFVIVP